jgi:hypothetical protein
MTSPYTGIQKFGASLPSEPIKAKLSTSPSESIKAKSSASLMSAINNIVDTSVYEDTSEFSVESRIEDLEKINLMVIRQIENTKTMLDNYVRSSLLVKLKHIGNHIVDTLELLVTLEDVEKNLDTTTKDNVIETINNQVKEIKMKLDDVDKFKLAPYNIPIEGTSTRTSPDISRYLRSSGYGSIQPKESLSSSIESRTYPTIERPSNKFPEIEAKKRLITTFITPTTTRPGIIATVGSAAKTMGEKVMAAVRETLLYIDRLIGPGLADIYSSPTTLPGSMKYYFNQMGGYPDEQKTTEQLEEEIRQLAELIKQRKQEEAGRRFSSTNKYKNLCDALKL